MPSALSGSCGPRTALTSSTNIIQPVSCSLSHLGSACSEPLSAHLTHYTGRPLNLDPFHASADPSPHRLAVLQTTPTPSRANHTTIPSRSSAIVLHSSPMRRRSGSCGRRRRRSSGGRRLMGRWTSALPSCDGGDGCCCCCCCFLLDWVCVPLQALDRCTAAFLRRHQTLRLPVL